MLTNPVAVNGRKLYYDLAKIRERQYRTRINEATAPADLSNGTDWDLISQKIWSKFDERTQPRDIFEKKMRLWNSLRKEIEVCVNAHELNKKNVSKYSHWFMID